MSDVPTEVDDVSGRSPALEDDDSDTGSAGEQDEQTRTSSSDSGEGVETTTSVPAAAPAAVSPPPAAAPASVPVAATTTTTTTTATTTAAATVTAPPPPTTTGAPAACTPCGACCAGACPVPECVCDVFLWKNIPLSAAVFVIGLSFIYVFFFADTPIVSSLSWSLCLVTAIGALGALIQGAVEHFQPNVLPDPREFLPTTLSLPKAQIEKGVSCTVDCVERAYAHFRRCLLAESLVDTVKFVLLLWAVSHVASWCSASCAIITVFVLSFTVPRIYSEFKKDIDPVLAKGCHAVCDVTKTVSTKVRSFIPYGKDKKQQ